MPKVSVSSRVKTGTLPTLLLQQSLEADSLALQSAPSWNNREALVVMTSGLHFFQGDEIKASQRSPQDSLNQIS